jgi:ABC-type sugar transport system ATPase subunit
MSHLVIDNLRVNYAGRFGPVVALDGYSLDVAPGSLTVLLGESGCGKSTALNAIAGLVRPESGTIQLGDKTLFSRGGARRSVDLSPNRRGIGMVFQSYALWPHMVVLENVMYPALRQGMIRAEAERAARQELATVRCEALASRFPGELSGGQQQRVALARAMVARPSLLLFDEPLSNLDAGLRRGLRDELARLHQEVGFTGVYVTHDQSEALALGSHLAVMESGKIVQLGSPADLYERPVNGFVARFFGANVVAGRADAAGRLETAAGLLECSGAVPNGAVRVAFMPHVAKIELIADGPLQVVATMYVGSRWEIRLQGAGEEVLIEQPVVEAPPELGARARLRIPSDKLCVFAADG